MKALKLAVAAAALVFSAQSFADAGPTVKTGTVSYACQSGKKVTVKYGFNRQGLPTYASAKLGGKTRKLAINLGHSDVAGTFFGQAERGYRISTDYLDSKNFKRAGMMITGPNDYILFKNCSPRKLR